jgi:phosphatidate cytidylyltransferase
MTNPVDTPKPFSSLDRRLALAAKVRALASRLQTRLTDLGPRAASSLILIIGALGTLLLSPTIFVLAWLAAALRIHWEWQRLIGGDKPRRRLAIGAFALVAAAALAVVSNLPLAILVIVLAAIAAGSGDRAGFRIWAAAGVVYAGSLIISLGMLRLQLPFGARAIAWLFAVVWGTDVVAYFAGRLIGGPKFLPQISPSKTWSGTLTGVCGGACLGTAFLAVMADVTGMPNPAPLAVLFLLGLLTAMIAQAGDLFESWTKRQFGVKDSGGLIPGHGGLMDRLDGFIAAAAWAALVGLAIGFPSAAEGLFHWI